MKKAMPAGRQGFTLMEILVYVSVLALIVLAVSGFLTWSAKSSAKARAIREATDAARRAMGIMVYEIRGAKGIYVPTSTSTQLSLETSHYLPYGEDSAFIDFYLCGETASTLCFRKEAQNPVAITSDRVKVSNLEFLQLSATTPAIKINLKIDYKTSVQQSEYQASIDLSSAASLRNY